VAIRIVENAKTTRVHSRTKLDPESRGKQEKHWLRQAAKKYGYKLVKAEKPA
jgi:hypothetical protein